MQVVSEDRSYMFLGVNAVFPSGQPKRKREEDEDEQLGARPGPEPSATPPAVLRRFFLKASVQGLSCATQLANIFKSAR